MDLKTTLEQVLEEDFLGNLVQEAKKAAEPFEEKINKYTEIEQAIIKANSDPANIKILNVIDFEIEDGIKKGAEILKVGASRLRNFLELNKNKTEAIARVVNYQELEKLWEDLLSNSNIQVIDFKSFPEKNKETFIVFYSADWCGPCKFRKPTYAKLSSFFDKSQLFYTSDEDLAKNKGVDRYPTLVAYFPDGSVVQSSLPLNTQDFWDTLNNLIVLGKNFKGNGELVCTETECKIETK